MLVIRWGVPDENTDDHLTWIVCSAELQRCKRQSMGLFFLSLQSEKYGYMPLPKYILKDKIDNKPFTSEIKDLFDVWYKYDDNQLPNGHFVLESLTDANRKTYWDDLLPTLRQAWTFIVWSVSDYGVMFAFSNEKSKIL